MRAPTLKGPLASAWRALASPWASWLLMLWIGVALVFGLQVSPAAHPAGTGWLQLPLVLTPLAVLAAAIDHRRGRLGAVLLAVGWVGVVAGAAVAGWAPGVIEYGKAPATETYDRLSHGRTVPAHLGGTLRVAVEGEVAFLWLGTGSVVKGTASLPMREGPEVDLGPWAVWWLGEERGATLSGARLRLRPRAGGAKVEERLRLGDGLKLPDGTAVSLTKLSGDFRKALGPAAQVELSWGEERRTAWHFAAQPGLDEQVGDAPWIVELLEVEVAPVLRLGVRRRGLAAPAQVGWALMLLGLLVGAARREAS